MIRSQTIRLLGVDDRFVETGHVVVENDDVPEIVILNGDCFIACDARAPAPGPAATLEYRKVRPFRFVRKVLP